MTQSLAMLVCDTQASAVRAAAFLVGRGYPRAAITTENVTSAVSYDAVTYGGGGLSDSPTGTWVVIGRK